MTKTKNILIVFTTIIVLSLVGCSAQPDTSEPISEAELAITAGVIQSTLLAPLTQTAEAEKALQQAQTAAIDAFIQQMTQTAQSASTLTPNAITTATPIIIVQPNYPATTDEQRMRIQFAPGAISSTVTGRVMANGVNYYVLRAMKGQTMTVTVTSAQAQALLTIYGITDGYPLVRGNASGATSYEGVLPITQDYGINIVSGGATADYIMQITIQY